MSFSLAVAEPVLALIRRVEARSDYDIVFGGIPAANRPKTPITQMTIAEVQAWQDWVVSKGAKSSACGAYQFIRKTLTEAAAQAGYPRTAKFNKDCQDRMAMYLLRKRGFEQFLRGSMSQSAMMIALSKEWASFPVPADMPGASRAVRRGQSYYAGDGLNKALVSVEDVAEALIAAHGRFLDAPDATVTTAQAQIADRSPSLLKIILDFLFRRAA